MDVPLSTWLLLRNENPGSTYYIRRTLFLYQPILNFVKLLRSFAVTTTKIEQEGGYQQLSQGALDYSNMPMQQTEMLHTSILFAWS